MTDKNVKPFVRRREIARTADGFANLVQRTGLGIPGQNTLSFGTYTLNNLLSRNRILLEAMYRQSWVVGKMVDAVAEDMTRAGIEVTGLRDVLETEKFQQYLNRMKVWDALLDVTKWSRLYGGAIAILQISGQNLGTPLNVDTVGPGQFQGLAVFDRWMVQPDLQNMIQEGPDIGLPAYYRIVTGFDVKTGKYTYGSNVHYSRIVRMVGIKQPAYQAMTEEYWGISVIERLYDRLISYDTATMGTANLIDKAHLRRVGIDGLREILAAGGPAEENLVKMFQYVRMLQSNEGITLLDKEDQYSADSYSFSGLDNVLLQFGQQLSGATGIPLVRLFGQSPAGMSATGESDLRNYYDEVGSKQESVLRSPVETIIQVAYRSMTGKPLPTEVSFKFAPLWQLSDTEKATNAKTITEAVVGAHAEGLIPTAAAMRELRQSSEQTGVFDTISDEDIAEAGMAPPPVPTANPELGGASATETPNPTAQDTKPSLSQRIAAWLKGGA